MRAAKRLLTGYILRSQARKGSRFALGKLTMLSKLYKRSIKSVKVKPLVSIGAALAAVSTVSGLLLWYRTKK